MPMRKELSSFLIILLIAGVTVLTVLLVNAKRELLAADRLVPPTPPTATTSPKPTPNMDKPAARTYTAPFILPKPRTTGTFALEKAIAERRSRRAFSEVPVTQTELGQILWSAQGVTDLATGKRTVPSAREAYPFTIFVVIRNVAGMKPGLYEYLPKLHALGDLNVANAGDLLTAGGVQEAAQKAPVVILPSAAYGKAYEVLKDSYMSSSLIEAGHIGQNIYLQVESLGMGTVVMAGFDAKKVGASIKLDPAETIVYVIPLGHRGVEAPQE